MHYGHWTDKQKNFYVSQKDKRQKKALDRYQNFTNEEKEKKKHQYYLENYMNLSWELKQNLV